MSKFSVGDLVVLKSGSMKMCVEGVSETGFDCVWSHEGTIGRDSFGAEVLTRWEARDETPRPLPRSFDTEAPRPTEQADAPKPYRPGPRPMVDDHAKPYRPSGDSPKPYRPAGDGPKPYRPTGDKPYRPSGDKPFRPGGDKPFRPGGDKPFRAGADGPKPYRPAGDKPHRDGPPKPYRPAGAPDGGAPRKTGWDGKPRDKKFFRKDE